ncbi:N-acetylglucosaminyl deacetylase, LmbE family [Austwickia chelonae]|uniref:Methyltransferase domain-containing protein n=1 Tax=Austwickia chelonae NBRC 105200 TaxID=1184607 RepID=K6VTT4_9MICO|nr:PIG-L family deacetylase [Austwickia chelonae]GAB78755.1 hypothetical protein AUCHE_16_01780 [Austwickia chelonae NBRC 105200]SEW35254.1 N-acetylglucosaminyl deacetylase, LmbE family [Austwickia chelonae]
MTGPSGKETPTFHHDQPGTPEHRWLTDPRWAQLPATTPHRLDHRHVVVLSAHPDDETLGIGATLADLATTGARIDLVIATDGESSHPGSTLWTPGRLGQTRRTEARHALSLLAPDARLHLLGLPDGRLADDPAKLLAALQTHLPDLDRNTVVLAPYPDDGHPDHDLLGALAHTLAAHTGADLLHYPIWLWHRSTPDDLDWSQTTVLTPSAHALHTKRAALLAHATQTSPLSPLPGDEPLLPRHVLAHFERVVEVLIAPRTPTRDTPQPHLQPHPRPTRQVPRPDRADTFDALFEKNDDPWNENSWYERRKRRLTLSVLAREHYGSALEIGCATGALTAELVDRADHVIATDISAQALARARRRDLPRVDWRHDGQLTDLPDHTIDLVVLSEVAYFLTGLELLHLLRHAARVLRPGGEILLVDWRARTEDIPLDGELVHDQAERMYTGLLRHRLTYADTDLRIDCWGGPGALGPHQERR